jgi:nucleotide-binding universal stress UspA family protein
MPHLHDTEIADTHPNSRVALKNIVFATDLSPTAKKALPYAVAFARQYRAAVYVVHALHPKVYPFALPDTWPMLVEAEEQVREEGKKELKTALQGIAHELVFKEGTVWGVLSEAIRKNNADLIVLGTHGRSGIGLLGESDETTKDRRRSLLGRLIQSLTLPTFLLRLRPLPWRGRSAVKLCRNSRTINLSIIAQTFGA